MLSYKLRRRMEQAKRRGTPEEVEARVRCCGAMHRIVLTPQGRLVLCDHPRPEETKAVLALAGLDSCRCFDVLNAWRKALTGGYYKFSRKDFGEIPECLFDKLLLALETRNSRRHETYQLQKLDEERKKKLYSLPHPELRDRCEEQVRRRAAHILKMDLDMVSSYNSPCRICYDPLRGRLRESPENDCFKIASTSLACVLRAMRQGRDDAVGVDITGRALVWKDDKWEIA